MKDLRRSHSRDLSTHLSPQRLGSGSQPLKLRSVAWRLAISWENKPYAKRRPVELATRLIMDFYFACNSPQKKISELQQLIMTVIYLGSHATCHCSLASVRRRHFHLVYKFTAKSKKKKINYSPWRKGHWNLFFTRQNCKF